MRRLTFIALLLAGACAPQESIRVTTVPAAPVPASAGTPEERAARQLDRALAQDARRDRRAAADPYAGSAAGEAAPGSNLEIGGGDGPAAVPQIGVPLR
jgi:hypothetical protein